MISADNLVLPGTIAEVIACLARAPEIVVPLVREVPPGLRKRRPGRNRGSAHEHACHLALVHALFLERLDYMLSDPHPIITPYDPGTQDADGQLLNLDLDRSLEQFVTDRAKLVERLRQLSAADWERRAEHGEYSHYSVFIMFRHMALHDFLHAYRIEEILLRKDWTS